MMLTDLL